MDQIQGCVQQLIQAVREDSAYQRYLACEQKLKGDPELKKQIDEFRVDVYHMNNDETEEDMFEAVETIEKRYEKLRRNPQVNAYLEAELDVCRMMQQIQDQLRRGIELNIPNV